MILRILYVTIVSLVLLTFTHAIHKREIQIGAIFPPVFTQSEIAFRAAVRRANMNTHGFELVPSIKHVSDLDSFKAEIAACELLDEGVAAIFGPASNITSAIVDSICNTFHIPHVMAHWTYDPMMYHYSSSRGRKPRNLTVNVYPDSDVLAGTLADIIKDYDWKNYVILYDIADNLIRLKDVLGLHGPKDPPCSLIQLDQGNDYRPALKKIYYSNTAHIILSVEAYKIADIFNQARDMRMIDEYKNYFIVSLDGHTINLEKEVGEITSNITTIRMLDPTSDEVENAASFMRNEEKKLGRTTGLTKEEYMHQIQAESIIFYDAVQLFAQSLDDINSVNDIVPESISCRGKNRWSNGLQIASYMRRKEVTGISGPLTIDENGHRRDFFLEIVEDYQKSGVPLNYHGNGYKKFGTWEAVNKVKTTRTGEEMQEKQTESFTNKTFIVVSRIGAPFLMEKKPKEGEILEGNAQFEGYSIDLFEGIANTLLTDLKLPFNYKFVLVPDKQYGAYHAETKKWDGLVGHLLDRKSDFAICDLTITTQRRSAVDFTMPFMTLGLSILSKTPKKEEKKTFQFLEPLSHEVWICTAAAYISVSLLTFILARMADAEWDDPHPCKRGDSEEKENIWGLLNCTWLTMGSVMGQGSDILPKANSTRLVTGMWYFFALIMLASYTANLAAFLTMDSMEDSIKDVESLAASAKYTYGVLKGGSSANFFENSNVSLYKRMWQKMKTEQPSVFTSSNDEGRDRVLNPKAHYAFFMESTTLEYMTNRNCELTQIGGLLDSKGYGIAMPKDSPYRKKITGAILKMSERGKLHGLKEYWWRKHGVKGKCTTDAAAAAGGATELDIKSVGGVFLLVVIGVATGILIAIFEFLWNVRTIAVDEKISQWEALKREALFAIKVNVTSKPVEKATSDMSSYSRSKRSRSSTLE